MHGFHGHRAGLPVTKIQELGAAPLDPLRRGCVLPGGGIVERVRRCAPKVARAEVQRHALTFRADDRDDLGRDECCSIAVVRVDLVADPQILDASRTSRGCD